jgi:tellurite resistance protein
MGLFADAVGRLFKNTNAPTVPAVVSPGAAPAAEKVEGSSEAAPAAASAGPASARDLAYLDALVYAVAAKGELNETDYPAVAEAVAELPAFAGADDAKLEALVDGSLDRLEKGGWDTVLANLATALPEADDRQQAFALAVAVQNAAGEVDESETEYLGQLAAAFGYSDEEAQKIVDAVEAQLGQGGDAEEAAA